MENNPDKVEVAIVMDSTGSMQTWIDSASDTVLEAFTTLQNENPNATFRLACVCYRDIGDEIPFIIVPFTEDISEVQTSLKNVKALGGSDEAEDIAGALEKVLKLEWSQDTCKLVLWVCDAPAHGSIYHSSSVGDRYPKGDPNGLEPSEQIKELSSKGIDFTMFRINHSIDKMVEIFSSIYESIDKSFFTLLDVVKQDDKYKKIDLYDSSIISGFIDLSTYDDDYTYDYGKKEVSTTNDKSSFCTATVESVRKTIKRFCKKK